MLTAPHFLGKHIILASFPGEKFHHIFFVNLPLLDYWEVGVFSVIGYCTSPFVLCTFVLRKSQFLIDSCTLFAY